MAIPPWKKLSSRYVLQDTWLSLRADRCKTDDGHVIDPYYILETSNWVHIVAFDAEQRVIVTRQYRHGVEENCLEIPAGIIDAEDSSAEAAGRRELLEETGYSADTFVDLGVLLPNPARQNNVFYTFLAENARQVSRPIVDPTENIQHEAVSIEDLLSMIRNGTFKNSLHVSSLMLALLYKGMFKNSEAVLKGCSKRAS